MLFPITSATPRAGVIRRLADVFGLHRLDGAGSSFKVSYGR